METVPTGINEFLQWLTGAQGGAFLVIMFVVSWQLENLEFWTKIPSGTKQLIILLVASALSACAVALQYNPELLAAIDPYFRAVSYVVVVWLTSQAAHKIDKSYKANLMNK